MKKNELIFNFVVEVVVKYTDEKTNKQNNVLGVDLGKVEPFVASLTSDNDCNSNLHFPFFANKKN